MGNCDLDRALSHHYSAESEYWDTLPGCRQILGSLTHEYNYRIVNNAMRLTGLRNGTNWFHLIVYRDDRTCPKCMRDAEGGRGGGWYKPNDLMPVKPTHRWCRCLWEIVWVDVTQPPVRAE